MLTYVDNLLGAFLIGVILSSIFYGFTWLQVYLYYAQHSSRDRMFLKYFVAVLTGLDSLHLVLLCHGLYVVLITNFGNLVADLHAPWSLVAQCIVGVCITTCIQLSYAVKIYQLSERKNIFVPLAISMLSAAELVLGVVFSVKSYQIGSFTANTPSVPYGASSLVLEVICGIFITAGMVYYILQQRSGLQNTNRVLNLLILYIVNSGALNLIFATSCLATYLIFPKTLIYAPFFFILIRLYPCSFLTILNSRVNVRSRLRGVTGPSGEGCTVVTISHEQVSDGSPLTTFKMNPDSNSDLSLVNRSTRRRTAEKAVGMDEVVD